MYEEQEPGEERIFILSVTQTNSLLEEERSAVRT